MKTERIVLVNDRRGDDHGVSLQVCVVEAAHMPGPHPGRSGKDYLFTHQGTFARADCYSVISPYGWRETDELCHFGYVFAFEPCDILIK